MDFTSHQGSFIAKLIDKKSLPNNALMQHLQSLLKALYFDLLTV